MKRRIVMKKNEYFDFVKAHNNRTNVYTTVYDFERFAETAKVESSVILDRIFLDFDAHGEDGLGLAFADLKIVLAYIKKYQHTIFFSGRGFHLFVYGEVTTDPRNIQAFFRTIKALLSEDSTLDERVGQSTRLRRIPNTVNMSSSDENGIPYYCIPLFEEDIDKGLEYILSLAKNPREIPRRVTGSELIVWPNLPSIESVGEEIEPIIVEGRLPILPCIYNAIMVENPSHMARVYLVSWYRDLLTIRTNLLSNTAKEQVLDAIVNEIEELVTSNEEIWLDWDKRTTKNHVSFIVNGNYNTPNCKTKLIPEGYCVGKCWRYPDYLDGDVNVV